MAKGKKKAADPLRRKSAAPSEGPDQDGESFHMDNEDMDRIVEVKRKPVDQVELTKAELEETFTRVVSGVDPNVPTKLVYFDHKTNQYVPQIVSSHLKIHFQMDSELIARDSDHAQAQLDAQAQAEADAQKVETAVGEGEEDVASAAGEPAFIKNQFNFSERATQTFNNPSRIKEAVTEPAATANLNDEVTAFNIFDTYLEDIENKLMAASLEEEKKLKKKKKNNGESDVAKISDAQLPIKESADYGRAMKMMERMIVTNFEAEDFNYYKYYEDKNETKREDGRGSFINLWKFKYEQAMGKSITSIVWNPVYKDLFAVGFGSYDFLKQGSGMVCVYTLKNTSYPEYIFETDHGVMSVDFNKDHPSLLCVGMYDGSVAVYDVYDKKNGNKPIFASSSPATKHTDPVWQVYWGEEKENVNFYSVSSDGKVINWVLAKTELDKEEMVTLKLLNEPGAEAELDETTDSSVFGHAGGSCFDFNKNNKHLFVVGTEEGVIQLYSKQFNTTFKRAFIGHHMAIYSVKWNKFHPQVFLSCSADWTVKLWECNVSAPIMTFDLNHEVGDVAWSPFSATVFATIATDGKVRVYDLSVNKHEPIGDYKVQVKKSKLTKIAFNPDKPIILVGDDKGVVLTLKLSNNLRKMTATTLEEIDQEVEVARLDKAMIMPDRSTDDIRELLEAANEGKTEIGK